MVYLLLCSVFVHSQIRFPATSGGPGGPGGPGQHDSLESLAAGQLWIEFASAPGRTGTTATRRWCTTERCSKPWIDKWVTSGSRSALAQGQVWIVDGVIAGILCI